MNSGVQASLQEPLNRIKANRQLLADVRSRGEKLFRSGATGVQVAAALSEGTDEFLLKLLAESLAKFSEADRKLLAENSAMIAVGGSGRGELAPYSDTDLLFLFADPVESLFGEFTSLLVREYWDVGLKLGQSVRGVADTIAMARQEPQVATALVDMRLLWGSQDLFNQLQKSFHRKILKGRLQAFIQDCINGRLEERQEHGATVLQLEPDVKCSLGGLRDVHMIRWIGTAAYGAGDLNSLRLRGVLSRPVARQLLTAYEFLLRVRADLHFHAGRAQDVLIRDEQLRITSSRGIEDQSGQRGVERFMQEYFRHSTSIADTAHRFLRENRPQSFVSRVVNRLVTHRFNDIFKRSGDGITVVPRERAAVCADLEQILQLFYSASLYRDVVAPEMLLQIKEAVPDLEGGVSYDACRIFRRILRTTGGLGQTLRAMYETGVLELLIPRMRHARGLLQFNQYHSYTVDEHTFQAIEAVEAFEHETGLVGDVYRSIRHKATLHLAILLHDVGKGFDEDHSEVGRRIAEEVGTQFKMSDHKRGMLVYLVHQHLLMANVAFRRDITDPVTLLNFSRSVGSPEILKMLYVLTAADVSAVGPGTFTDWKAELLADLYKTSMVVLAGERYDEHERRQRDEIKREVTRLAKPGTNQTPDELKRWVNDSLDAFPSHYFIGLDAPKIVSDLTLLRDLLAEEVIADGYYDSETDTVEYRVITQGQLSDGCFHKICGLLTAKRLEILTAEINTNLEGTVIDRFRVIDNDYDGAVPQDRIDLVAADLKKTLRGEDNVEKLFGKYRRFGSDSDIIVLDEESFRVVVDNESSQYSTIIDVFSHDRLGLLYTLSKAIYDLGLSVKLAKIGTHLDQVVDVFYVQDASGQKIGKGEELARIRDCLTSTLDEFETRGFKRFTK